MQACEGCGGLGWIEKGDCEDGNIETCPVCEGTGTVIVDEELLEISKEDDNAKTKDKMP